MSLSEKRNAMMDPQDRVAQAQSIAAENRVKGGSTIEPLLLLNYPHIYQIIQEGNIENSKSFNARALAERLWREGDLSVPNPAVVYDRFYEQLQSFTPHFGLIPIMTRPVLQIVPVFDHEGAGFRRIIEDIDRHPTPGQINTYVHPSLRQRWDMDSECEAKIVGWQAAITEAAFDISKIHSTPALRVDLSQGLRYDLREESSYIPDEITQLIGKKEYALLFSAPKDPKNPLAVLDCLNAGAFTILADPTRTDRGSFASLAYYAASSMRFIEEEIREESHHLPNSRYRLSVVVDL